MSDDPMFDYVLARSRTRESSILAIATIAVSASLIILGLYLQERVEKPDLLKQYQPWIEILGVMFAVLGITYREVTAQTIHRNDENWLREYVRNFRTRCPVFIKKHSMIKDPLAYCTPTAREPVLRVLFSLPIVAWAFAVDQIYGWIAIGLTIVYLAVLSCFSKKD